MPPFKKYEEIASRTELKRLYELAVKEAEAARSSISHERILIQQMSAEKRGLKQDLKKEQSKLIVLSKEKKSADEQKKSAGWNGAAVVSVALLYQAWRIIGFPGGYQWAEWWEHEACFGAITFFVTIFYAQLNKLWNKY
tara:strand:+ start:65 stop:481 length:417 start_codon:yes stop_codon:yes gene_type:complete